ncbi:AAA family ATPase [Georgenia sunbinii]|uniref:AAA family ATPase n=1 Tax=Georgenia sunbinii TaxID=3117728 RepID=UPI002F269826
MLRHDDPLPHRPRRVVVAGVSGAGKTSLARRLAPVLDAPHTEIDALFHGRGWAPREQFLDDVRTLVARDAWTTEWQYRPARPILTARADLLVWLDLPFATVTLPRLVRRTIRRRLRREVLWNGNVEPPLWTLLTDPEHVVRWAIATRHKDRERIPQLTTRFPRLTIVRLRTPRDVERWVAGPLADHWAPATGEPRPLRWRA